MESVYDACCYRDTLGNFLRGDLRRFGGLHLASNLTRSSRGSRSLSLTTSEKLGANPEPEKHVSEALELLRHPRVDSSL